MIPSCRHSFLGLLRLHELCLHPTLVDLCLYYADSISILEVLLLDHERQTV
jgi:hypothetical protein